MIDIYIKGKRADYFGSFTIKKDNPLFADFDVEPTEHTYTLTLPTTATNVKIFSFAQYSLANIQGLPARIEVDGIPILNGSCNVQSWDENGFSVYFNGIAPYEDTTDNSIKRMLADESLMNEIFVGYAGFDNVDASTSSGVKWSYKSAISGTQSAGLIRAYLLEKFPIEDAPFIKNIQTGSRLAFTLGVILTLLEEKYRLSITASAIKNCLILTNSADLNPDIPELLPHMTAKNFLHGIAVAFGCRLKFDFQTNTITFVSLNEIKEAKPLEIQGYNVGWNKSIGLTGEIKFTDIPPIEEKAKETIDGEEIEITKKFYLSSPLSSIISQDAKKSFIIPLSFPDLELIPNSLTTSILVSGKYKYESVLKKEQVGYSLIVDVDLNLQVDRYTGWFKQTSIISKETLDSYFQILKKVINKGRIIKLKTHINPIQFTTLDMWKPVFVENIGNMFIKSINFKSDGETEIEAYLL